MDELKPCPFCGEKMRKQIGVGGITFFYCENSDCGAIVSFNGSRKLAPGVWQAEDPAENFNRRVGNQQNADYADIYKDICDKYGKNFRTLLDKAKALREETTTLKKALDMMYADNKEYNPDGMGNPAYYIQQAQEGKK